MPFRCPSLSRQPNPKTNPILDICRQAAKIRFLGSMRLATSRQVVEHCKEMAVQTTTMLKFAWKRFLKIMSRLTTSHQSIACPRYVPYSIYYLIYADLDVDFSEPIQHDS